MYVCISCFFRRTRVKKPRTKTEKEGEKQEENFSIVDFKERL